MWLCLADGRARSTADLKRLATAARVRAKRAGDAAAANTRDRQARDQRRRQREQHDRRAAPAVAKTVRPQRGQCGCPAHAVCGMCVDQGKLAAAEQAAIDLETRFHASTNVVMDLERPEDETAALLQRCVHVSDETKRRLLGEWSDERMAHALPLHACASCGVRDPSLTYTRVDVSALPRTVSVRVAGGEDETRHVFELSPEQCAKYRGLQNKKVRLAFPNGASNDRPNGDGTHEFRDTDISRVISCWESDDGTLYHLHPELVDRRANEHGVMVPCAMLCQWCGDQADARNKEPKAPKLSLAAGIDYESGEI